MQELNGAYITGEELENLKEVALNHFAFERIFKAVKENYPMLNANLKIDFAYKGDVPVQEGVIITVKQINFVNEDKTLKIVYSGADEYAQKLEYISLAQVVVAESDKNSLISIKLNKFGEVIIETIEENYPDNQVPQVEEDLPDNPDYSSKEYNEGGFSTKAWWNKDGCLPGGYEHCGGNCGYSPRDHGGGTPINGTDRCCVLHDSCYSSGTRKCSCDEMLLNCTENHTTWAAVGMRFTFSGC